MAPLVLRAPLKVTRSGQGDSFAAGSLGGALQRLSLAAAPAPKAAAPLLVECLHGQSGRKCMLTGKKANNGYTVSFSHARNKTLQQANLQYKRIYWEREERWIRLRISTKALKTIEKRGLESMAADAGLDLYSLRFSDGSEARKAWKAANPGAPQAKDKRAPKWRPLGKEKPLFVPKWKKAQLDALPAAESAAKLEAFRKKWFALQPSA